MKTISLLSILTALTIAAVVAQNPVSDLLATSVIAGIFGYVLGHGHGQRDERQRWVRDRLERACRLVEKIERGPERPR